MIFICVDVGESGSPKMWKKRFFKKEGFKGYK